MGRKAEVISFLISTPLVHWMPERFNFHGRWMMERKVVMISSVVVVALGLLLGLPFAQQTQTAPAKGELQVTYYFLPG